jgi:hypothetical protein
MTIHRSRAIPFTAIRSTNYEYLTGVMTITDVLVGAVRRKKIEAPHCILNPERQM